MATQRTKEEVELEVVQLKSELEDMRKNYQLQIEENLRAKEKAEKNEKMLHSVVEAAAGKIGQDFFDNIVLRLSEWLGAECVLIGKMVEGERIEAVPLLLDGEISHGFSYDLAGSPCDITTRKGYCSYSENVIELFPKDRILVDLNAEGYIGTALYNKNGDTNGVICAVSRKKLDIPPYAHNILKIIGARVTAEIERQKIEEALLESNNAKDKFFSIIAHDLQNPLNILNGFSGLLKNEKNKHDKGRQDMFIEHIYNAARNMNNLVSDLLTWSLSQRDMIETNMEKTELKPVLLDTLALVKTMAIEKNIQIAPEVPDGCFVFADRNMLATVIRNLVTNAIKFTHRGGQIKISLETTQEGKQKIIVEDNGVGIKTVRINTIFRIDEDTSTKGTDDESGTGLGLVLCKEFIEKQKGRIWVESEVGKGSRFVFTLDRA